jgi:hypothetical protein
MDVSSLGFFAGKQAVSLASNAVEKLAGAGKSFLDVLTEGTSVSDSVEAGSAAESISKEDLLDLLKQFQQRANLKFAASGVDTTRPVQIAAGPAGSIQVAGGHPDRAAIEQLLSSDNELRSMFEAIAAAAEELDGVDPNKLQLVLEGIDAKIVS